MKKALTNKIAEHVDPHPSRRIEIRDALLPGFGLRVTPQGRKSWFVVGRVASRQVRHTIGTYPSVSLSDARKAAQGIIGQIQLGTYFAPNASAPAPLTFKEATKEFIAKHAKPNTRGWKRSESLLRLFATLDDRPLAEIRRAEVVRILDVMVTGRAPIRANRALAAIKKLFAWALDRGLIEMHPIIGLKPVGKEARRERVLTDNEIRSLWSACDTEGFPFGPLIQLLLLTGQRRGEVASMRWVNIDFEREIWTIPADLAKNGRAHEVPLSKAAIALILTSPVFNKAQLVFTTNGSTPVSGFGRAKARLDAATGNSNWRLHDLRRTTASGMARTGVSPHVIEKVLNHLSGQISGVAAIYNRHGYDSEKRDALDRWAASLRESIYGEEGRDSKP